MPPANYPFPRGFLWGSATSPHQVEGNNRNNNWAFWEQQPGRIKNGDTAGLACDWWGGRWKEDLSRAMDGGQNAHRFGIEWSRIQPLPDKWDEHALDHYRQMARQMVASGVTPMVTLHHFSDPLWLYEMGGWENPQTPELFNRYVHKVIPALQEYVNLWVTINEPNLYTYLGYMDGVFPPGKKDLPAAFTVLVNLLKGHAAAYRTIHSLQKEARVGVAHHIRRLTPARGWMPLDRLLAGFFSANLNEAFPRSLVTGRLNFALRRARLPEAIGTQDFFGLNYYTWEYVQSALAPRAFFHRRTYPPGARTTDDAFIANVPTGLFATLDWARGFKLPIIVTENGIHTPPEDLAPQYLVEHVHQLWRAVNMNWGIKGYFYWSLVDNFEWERGWSQRFGLWGLENATQRRIRRATVDAYAEICQQNTLMYSTVEKYAPQSIPVIYPD